MWRLMISDSFHLNNATTTSTFYIIYFNFYINIVLRISDSEYKIIIMTLSLILLASMLLSPIRLAKGLYLCPLTENDRKKYLKMMCLSRFIFMELLYGFVLLAIKQIYHIDTIKLILIFICISFMLLTLLLMTGFYDPRFAKQQYYLMNKLPIPKDIKITKETSRTPIAGIYLLITTLILSSIGVFLAFLDYPFDLRWLFYYIPCILVSVICMLIYFIRYFDIFITINANHEVYSYTRRKKAGAFHAD